MAETEMQNPEQKIVINHMPIRIQSVDRSFKDIKHWWEALQQAESVFFPNRSDLYDVLSTVEMDGQLTGLIDKRIRNTINKKIYFKDANDEKVDAVDDLIKLEAFKRLREERFRWITHGLFGVEFIPGKEFTFHIIPLKHINLQLKRITKEQWGTDGFSYDKLWNIVVRGEWDYFGILNKCAPYAIWKKGNMADWAQYIEVFGQPMIIFTYDAHDEATKKNLDEIMRSIGSGTKLQVPKQLELKMEDGKQNNGDGALQEKFRLACNEEMSVIVLGVTETTASSKSSGYAQSETHLKQQEDVTKDDMDDELNFLNDPQMIAIFKSYGYPVEGGEFCHETEPDLAKVKQQVDIINTISSRVPVDDDYIYEVTGIPKPDNYDELKKKMDEEKMLRYSYFQNENEPGDEEDLFAKDRSWWQKMRIKLADFFAPAPKD